MERESEQVLASEPYTDKPAPGSGYLLFLHLVVGGSILVIIVVTLSVASAEPVAIFAVGHAAVLDGLVYWGLLHAAYHTSYNFSGDVLNIRSGIFKSKVRLHLVKDAVKIRSIRRVLGFGFGTRGFCNRFRNGVVLIMAREKVFLSPSNPDIFIERVRSILPDNSAGESLLSGSGQ